MSQFNRLLLISFASLLGSFSLQSTSVKAITLNFPETTYNLANLLPTDPVFDYNQSVCFSGVPVHLIGVITTYPSSNPNCGPQEYLNILVNPDINQGIPSPTVNAPYGLTKLVGSVYLHDIFVDDGTGNLIYQSSQGSTNPDYFPFLAQNYPELPMGYISFEGDGLNKLFGTETASITQKTIDGVIYITSVGTINITGGEGIFAGASGTLTFLENGISGLPYIGSTNIQGTINIPEISTVPEPSTLPWVGSLVLLGLGAKLKRKLTKIPFQQG